MTLTADTGNAHHPGNGNGARPVEHWPTTAIRSALETGDISVWQRIVVAIKRDPYGRTARQVEEVLETAPPQGITRALSEVLIRSRQHLEATERAEAARHVRSLVARSGLSQQEFASRIGVPTEDLVLYLDGRVSPPASLVIRIRRLSDRFAPDPRAAPRGLIKTMTDLQRILRETKTIAVVGASAKPHRASHEVFTYLGNTGDYTLYPVNPTISEIDGVPTYPSLADLPVVPDLVDVFRRRSELAAVLDDVLALPQRPKTLWLQLGLFDEQVARDAESAGITVVMDRCLKVDHARLR